MNTFLSIYSTISAVIVAMEIVAIGIMAWKACRYKDERND